MQSQESLLWLYSSSSLHKNHPSGGGLTWKVSRRPLHAGTLCLPVSWQGRHGARSNAIPAWSCSSSTGCVEQCGLMVLFDPREAFSFFFLKYQQRLSSHCPAADGRNYSVAHGAVRVDAMVGWSDLKWVFIHYSRPGGGTGLVSDFPAAPVLWGEHGLLRGQSWASCPFSDMGALPQFLESFRIWTPKAQTIQQVLKSWVGPLE